jgi:IS30 family transposase
VVASIQQILADTGGIRPAQRRRSRLALSNSEREEISRSLVAGRSIRSIAGMLGRAPSTERYKTLTWDRGKEMAAHARFTLVTDIQMYFCDPQNPWQRGTNENTNGLLRQYFPKEIDISIY